LISGSQRQKKCAAHAQKTKNGYEQGFSRESTVEKNARVITSQSAFSTISAVDVLAMSLFPLLAIPNTVGFPLLK
jgi:hypothetical protein